MKTLIIAEKPAAGNDIARIVGATEDHKFYKENEHYIVSWAVGHLVGLQDPEDIDEKYKKWSVEHIPLPEPAGLKVLESSSHQFYVLKKLIHREDVNLIINAGDAGREGLLIQNWIYKLAGNTHPVKLLWASSLTDEAIKTALNNLHDPAEPEFVNLFREAEARAIADQIYGYNYSRLMTCLFANPGTTLSYGACQTPLLNLIVRRDYEIGKFKPEPFWRIHVMYQDGFEGTEVDTEGKTVTYLDKQEAERVSSMCNNLKAVVLEYKTEEKSVKAPALLNLAELQGIMGKKYGFTPDYTLELAQKLYETHKIISYPRTDSRYLSTDIYGEISQHVKSCNFGKYETFVGNVDCSTFPMEKAYFNNNKVTDHHALIPTINYKMAEIYDALSEDLRKCFDEVAVSFLAIFMPAYRYTSTQVIAAIGEVRLKSSGTTIIDKGFKRIYSILSETEEKESDTQLLPVMKEGELLDVEHLALKEDKTKPPARYTPGNIIKLIQKYKLGTAATSANTIQTLINRGFVTLEKGKYVSTPLGRSFLAYVPDNLKSKDFRMSFEEELQRVNTGGISKEEFLASIREEIEKNIPLFKAKTGMKKIGESGVVGKCPICKRDVLSGKNTWYCSGYAAEPKCTFSLGKKICGKEFNNTFAEILLQGQKTPLVEGLKFKSGKIQNAYMYLDEKGNLAFEFPKKAKRKWKKK